MAHLQNPATRATPSLTALTVNWALSKSTRQTISSSWRKQASTPSRLKSQAPKRTTLHPRRTPRTTTLICVTSFWISPIHKAVHSFPPMSLTVARSGKASKAWSSADSLLVMHWKTTSQQLAQPHHSSTVTARQTRTILLPTTTTQSQSTSSQTTRAPTKLTLKSVKQSATTIALSSSLMQDSPAHCHLQPTLTSGMQVGQSTSTSSPLKI